MWLLMLLVVGLGIVVVAVGVVRLMEIPHKRKPSNPSFTVQTTVVKLAIGEREREILIFDCYNITTNSSLAYHLLSMKLL